MPDMSRTTMLRFPGFGGACTSSRVAGVIIPASGETGIDIATASCIKRAGIALSGDLNIIRSSVNGGFLAYYLNSKKKLAIASLAQGSFCQTPLRHATQTTHPPAPGRAAADCCFFGGVGCPGGGGAAGIGAGGDF